MTDKSVSAALDRFIEKHQALQAQPPIAIYESEWQSVCYTRDNLDSLTDGDRVTWRPTKQTEELSMFNRLGEALEVEIHPDLVEFYSRYWSDPLPAKSEDGELSLLQVWNNDDLERLRSNLIGHALATRKQKRPLTFFFACTEPDGDYFLSIDNESGEILLEQPGKKPLRKLADNLADYIDTLEPLMIPDME